MLVYNKKTGDFKGYAFLYYELAEDAKAAVEAMNDQEFDGRLIRVEFSIPKSSEVLMNGLNYFE